MDTAFLLEAIDESDTYHNTAVESYKRLIQEKWSIILTDAILVELANGLSIVKWRQVAHTWITNIQKSRTIFTVVSTTDIFNRAVELYGSRPDKEWGLTDCISFIVMRTYKLTHALTLAHHFEQAGYHITITITIDS